MIIASCFIYYYHHHYHSIKMIEVEALSLTVANCGPWWRICTVYHPSSSRSRFPWYSIRSRSFVANSNGSSLFFVFHMYLMIESKCDANRRVGRRFWSVDSVRSYSCVRVCVYDISTHPHVSVDIAPKFHSNAIVTTPSPLRHADLINFYSDILFLVCFVYVAFKYVYSHFGICREFRAFDTQF